MDLTGKGKDMKFLIRLLASIGFYSALLSLPAGLVSIGLDMYFGVSFLTALLTGVKVTIGMFAAGIVVAIFSIGLASMYREYKENGDFNWLWDYFEHKEKGEGND